MGKPMTIDAVRFYASVVRSTLAMKLSRLDLTWHQAWALSIATSAYELRIVEIRRVMAFERWTYRAKFENPDVTVTATRTSDGLFVARLADILGTKSVHSDDMREIVKFIDEAVSEVPKTASGWWKIR